MEILIQQMLFQAQIFRNKAAFSLLEVLIVISLLGVIVTLGASSLQGRIASAQLKTFRQSMEKAYSFTCQNAFLRNAPTRIRITFNQEIFLEVMTEVNLGSYSGPEPLTDFSSLIPQVPSDVKFLALVSSYDKLFFTSGENSFYCLPTGVKDRGLILFQKGKRILGLDLVPDVFKSEYFEVEYQEVLDDEFFKKILDIWTQRLQ